MLKRGSDRVQAVSELDSSFLYCIAATATSTIVPLQSVFDFIDCTTVAEPETGCTLYTLPDKARLSLVNCLEFEDISEITQTCSQCDKFFHSATEWYSRNA